MRVFPRQFGSLLLILVFVPGVLVCTGCDSKKPADESRKGRQATAPGESQEAAQDAARIARLKNIVANRHTSAAFLAVRQFADDKTPGAFEAIAPGLTNENLMFRMCSAKALGTLGDPRALPLLRKALQSKYTGLRLAAIVGLGKLGPVARPASAELGALLGQKFAPMHRSVKHSRPDEYYGNKGLTIRFHLAVLDALGRMGGEDARAIVVAALKGARNPDVAWKSARTLKAMGAHEALLAASRNGSAPAWRMLVEMKRADALPDMLAQIRDPRMSDLRRGQIIYALGVLEDRRATGVLLEMLRSKSGTICRAAGRSLNKIADPNSLPGLMAYVRSAPQESLGLYSATSAIGAIETPAALDALRKLGAHPSSNVRVAVAYRLNERATIQDIPLLIDLLKKGSRWSNHIPGKALTRLLPDSAGPLLDLLPSADPSRQIVIARILVRHQPARPALRRLLKSDHEAVRNSVRELLWNQRDPSVPLVEVIDRGMTSWVDRRDIPELERLVREGNDEQSYLAIVTLCRLDLKAAWKHVRPMFRQEDPAPLQACNALMGTWANWLEREVIQMIKRPEGLSRNARRKLLGLLRREKCISPEAVALYRSLCDDGDGDIRSGAYRSLYMEASDESMALLARKALAGDSRARWTIGGNPDKRLAEAFAKLVEKAIKDKETWLGGYVHVWPTAPGVLEYVAAVGSNYSKQLTEARKLAAETAPD